MKKNLLKVKKNTMKGLLTPIRKVRQAIKWMTSTNDKALARLRAKDEEYKEKIAELDGELAELR